MAGPDAKSDPKLREAADGNSDKHQAFSPGRTNRPGSGKGSSNAFLPLAVILGILAFCLLILFLLLPRIMPDSGDMNRAIFTIRRQIDRKRRLFERSNPLEDWRTDRNQKDTQPDELPQEKNENTNPFKEIFGVEKPEDLTDLFSGEQAEEGISSGNFYNKGFFGAYEGGILFGDSDGIYRFSQAGDAEGEKIANKHARYINKYGEKLYYLDEIVDKIVCLDPDSGSTYDVYSYESEAGYIPESLYIYDKWCYFSNGRRLYRFNLEDAGENSPVFPPQAELVLEDFNSTGHVFPSLCFVRGKLVYNGKEGITAADPDGSNPRVISDKEGHLISNGTNIYCWFGVHHIFRVSMDGRTEEILTTDSDETISAVNCLGDWIYYISTTDDSSSLWRMAEDGSTPELITGIGDEGDNVLSFCIFPDPFDSGVSAYAYLSLFDNQGDVPSQTFEIYALDD